MVSESCRGWSVQASTRTTPGHISGPTSSPPAVLCLSSVVVIVHTKDFKVPDDESCFLPAYCAKRRFDRRQSCRGCYWIIEKLGERVLFPEKRSIWCSQEQQNAPISRETPFKDRGQRTGCIGGSGLVCNTGSTAATTCTVFAGDSYHDRINVQVRRTRSPRLLRYEGDVQLNVGTTTVTFPWKSTLILVRAILG